MKMNASCIVGTGIYVPDRVITNDDFDVMFGAMAATALTLVAEPLLYFEYFKSRPCPLGTAKDIEKFDPDRL